MIWIVFQVLPITDGETGDHVIHDKDAPDEVAASSNGSGSDLNITRAQSLEVLVPKGSHCGSLTHSFCVVHIHIIVG